MPQRHRLNVPCGWLAVLIAACMLWLSSTARGQEPASGEANSPDTARRQNQVATQKIEGEVRAALREAQRLAATSASKAVDRLKQGLDRLEDDTALPEKRRESLKH